MRKRLGFVGLVVLVFGSAGCGGSSDTPELGEVHGQVKLDGNPLPKAMVKFQPVAGGRHSSGETDDNGEYELQYSLNAKGALIGKHKVSISTGSKTDDESVPEKVPTKYNVQTELEVDVKAGDNELDFDKLDSKGEILQPGEAEKKAPSKRRSDGCS
jgi:hypothetical protein